MSSTYITEPATKGKVCLETTLGDIDIELWSRECPLACRNFVQLCMEGYYNGCIFHRLVHDFIVQTGDPTGTGHGGQSIYGDDFKNEYHQRLKFGRRGMVGMAGENKDQNRSQFFFTLGAANDLNNKHTLFGKVVGQTIFNLMKLNELEADNNERPVYCGHKIIGAKILVNPFNDIKPRMLAENERNERKRRHEEREKKNELPTKKNTSLLSFGDEMEDDEEVIAEMNKKLKSKSAHDLLEDELLSREQAVKPEEFGQGPADEILEDNEQKSERLDRIKQKFRNQNSKKAKYDEGDAVNDEDIDKIVDDHRETERQKEMDKITSELKQLQKEYKKSMRTKKETKSEEDEAETSSGMKMYNKLKLKFKTDTKGIVKTVDPKREEQTIALLERFQTKLQRATVQGILQDKKVDMSDQKSQEQIILATSEDQGKIDLDAEDIQGEEWMNHELVAPEDTSGVTKARDANMKDEDEEWYPRDDPRNRMNVRNRTQGGKLPDLFANAEPMALP